MISKKQFWKFFIVYFFGQLAFFLLLQKILPYAKKYININFLNNLSRLQKFVLSFSLQEIVFIFFLLAGLSIIGFHFNQIKKILKKQRKRIDLKSFLKYTIGAYLAFIIISIGVSSLLYIFKNFYSITIPWFGWKQKAIELIQNFNLNSLNNIIVLGTTIVLIGPLVEEIIYRGFITNFLLKIFKPKLALFLSASFFAIAHMERSVMGHLFILAYILAYIYYKTDSLIYTRGFHILVNWISFGIMVWMQAGL